jgi:NAD(P)-dependent dehydrogenase (short-subunit alcohol dehydrogenase family)
MEDGVPEQRLTERQTELLDQALAATRAKVAGKVVVVTGAARGIGLAIARALDVAGARVVATDRSWTRPEALREGLTREMDITDDAAIARVCAEVVATFGTVDVLVNGAGIVSETLYPPRGAVKTLETADADWETMFRTNVFGTLKVVRRFIEPMLAQQRGSIVNIVSSGVLHASAGGGYFAARPWSTEMPYQASKAALTAMTFYLAEEVHDRHVNVNALMPGHTRASWYDATARAFLDEGRSYSRRPVVAEHLVPLVLFLAAQAGGGVVTGRLYDAGEWNYDHGYGDVETWHDRNLPADLEAMYRKVEASAPAFRRSGTPRLSFEASTVQSRAAAKAIAEERS